MTREEFKETIAPLQDGFYRLARWMMRNDEDAEDIAQEILLRLWKMGGRLAEYGSVRALGLKMTRNLCLDNLKRKSRGNMSLDIVTSSGKDVTASVEELEFDAADTRALLGKLMLLLPEQQQLILRLRSVEELEIEEIAAVTELTSNHVRVLLSRARKTLRNEYTKIIGYETR